MSNIKVLTRADPYEGYNLPNVEEGQLLASISARLTRLSKYTIQPTLIVELIRAFRFRDIPSKEPDRPRAQLGKVQVHFRYQWLERTGQSGHERK